MAGTKNRTSLVRKAYYRLRPHLGVPIRKRLQRLWLRGWEKKCFPSWPVDRTVDQLLEKLLALSMKAHGIGRIPFIWFWPDGQKSCAILTHEVEESAGFDSCFRLMDMDDSFGIKSSFQFIPEKRYAVSRALLERTRGLINIHDLHHDGHLRESRETFLSARAASRIHEGVRRLGVPVHRAFAGSTGTMRTSFHTTCQFPTWGNWIHIPVAAVP